jgi:predicted dehydrogenase
MKPMGWALVGYGGMGRWHTEKLKTMTELDIRGVYDIAPSACKLAAENGLSVYASLDELIADKSVELVTIATPNDLHRPLAIKLLQAGKHVISEKPVTLSSKELQQIIDAADEAGRLFTTHQNRRWDEDFLIISKLYREGTLGNVMQIESRVHGSRGIPGDWRKKAAHGGGMILDWGVHMLDQLLLLVEEPVVSTWCTVFNNSNDEVDDGFKAVLTFASGLITEVEVGTNHFVSLPRWYMAGDKGTTVVEDWQKNGKTVLLSRPGGGDAKPVITAAGMTKTMAPREGDTTQEYPLPEMNSDVRDFYRNMVQAVRGEAEQLVTHHQLMRVMRLMEAMFESARLNTVIHSRI